MKLIKRLIPTVSAHCDVPCGIYETDTMRHAADTCLKMFEKFEALDDTDSVEGRNNFVRIVETKEHHAQVVKNQITILWTDYFKPEHLDQFPKLHETLWLAAKQASKVKQTMSREECEKLIDQVGKVVELFNQSKANHAH